MCSPRRITRTLAVAAVSVLLSVTFARAQVPAIEREALIALYNSTNGDNWEFNINWLGDEGTECTWFGVTCSGGSVWRLDLQSNELTGSVPPELGNLSNLERLDLHSNQLVGAIPAELGNLANLKYLFLNYNDLTGAIPAALGNLTHLVGLVLDENGLSGNIPPQLGNLVDLESLVIRSNELSGDIPPELGNLVNLVYLDLPFNQLSGNIPPQLGNLIHLRRLDLNSNRLTGTIPPELGNLVNLTNLFLDFNELSGTIPGELGALAELQYLRFNFNRLDGSIPPELGNLSNLFGLDLDFNQLAGSIPVELGNLPNLRFLLLRSNKLTGVIPPELENLPLTLESGLDLRWNAVHSDDAALISYLNDRQIGGDWQSTQTIAPENVAVDAIGDHTVWLSWDAVSYQDDPGGYEVFSSPSGAGVWTSGGWTASKLDIIFPVTGLDPATSYDFSVATYTDPHINNFNLVTSDLSPEATATTADVGCAQPIIEISIDDVITLTVVGDWDTYLWSTGETTPSIVIDAPSDQWYWVTVTGAGPCEETGATLAPGTVVFEDGFESADTSAWSSTTP